MGDKKLFRGHRDVTYWKLLGTYRHHLISCAHFTEEESEAQGSSALSARSTNSK